jgi:ribosome-interacting GTPase 1
MVLRQTKKFWPIMPANLSPEFLAARERYNSAKSIEERISALQEMLTTIPKHKGTEKMQADLKTRLAKLQSQLTKQKRSGGRRYDPSHVKREGAGQVVLTGPPNAGKSALAHALTNAQPEVAEYPFTTRTPQPAMMQFENIQIQLVDAPAVSEIYMETWLPNLVRVADVVVLVADTGSDDCLAETEAVINILAERKVELIAVTGRKVAGSERVAQMPTLLAANKSDRPGSQDRLELLQELLAHRFGPALEISASTGDGLEDLRKRIFESLFIIRVCSKAPGKPADTKRPFVLPEGATVSDFAREVHADFAQKLQFARIWGEGKHDGQRVHKDHVLTDGDVVELHL